MGEEKQLYYNTLVEEKILYYVMSLEEKMIYIMGVSEWTMEWTDGMQYRLVG